MSWYNKINFFLILIIETKYIALKYIVKNIYKFKNLTSR